MVQIMIQIHEFLNRIFNHCKMEHLYDFFGPATNDLQSPSASILIFRKTIFQEVKR